MLVAGLDVPNPALTARAPLPAAEPKFFVAPTPPTPPQPPPAPSVAPPASAPGQVMYVVLPQQPAQLATATPYNTEYDRRRRQQQGADRPVKRTYCRTQASNKCRRCGQPNQAQTGHRRVNGRVYCPNSEALPFEQWKAMQMAEKQ